jgi:hypothetical protein
MIKKKKDA